MKRQFILFIILSLTTFSLWAKNQIDILVDLSPAGSFHAVSEKVRGKIRKEDNILSSKKIEVSIKSFKTGIDLRDEHFWDHLTSNNKNSKAILTELIASEGSGKAILEVNGIKKPIILSYKDQNGKIEAHFKVKASDFKLPPKSYLGVGVKDEVNIKVEMEYK